MWITQTSMMVMIDDQSNVPIDRIFNEMQTTNVEI